MYNPVLIDERYLNDHLVLGNYPDKDYGTFTLKIYKSIIDDNTAFNNVLGEAIDNILEESYKLVNDNNAAIIFKFNSASYIVRPNTKIFTYEEIKKTRDYTSTISNGYVVEIVMK